MACLKRGLKWIGIALLVLVILGVSFQTVATQIDNRTYARGQLYTVEVARCIWSVGQRQCGRTDGNFAGRGANESCGGTGCKTNWRIIPVCAYDRAGLGWSEAAATPRDPITIVHELHELLAVAGIQPPYVMAGHSYGAVLARIYAAQYPAQVVGIVLVDGMPLELKDLSRQEFEQYKWVFYAAQAPLWMIYRLGVGRLFIAGSIEEMGYPPEIAAELAALTLRNQTCDTDIAEKGFAGMWDLMQASLAAEDLGKLPMAVLWASLSGTNQASYAAYRTEVAGYSANSVTHYVEGADHGSILGNQQYAQQVSAAIGAVIKAAQTGAPLVQQQTE